MYDKYKIAPGYALIKRDPEIKKAGDFYLPEEEKVNRGTVLKVGANPVEWKRWFRIKPFIRQGDRVVIGQVRQEIDKEHVVCHIHHLLVRESGQ